MRFKSFLDECYGNDLAYFAIDSCTELVPEEYVESFQELDIIDVLVDDCFNERVKAPQCDLVVCFGFMHHVPTFELRAALMRGLADKTGEGGAVAVSFWRFASDEALRKKALESTEHALQAYELELEEGDYLLGWQNKEGAYRYCHSFTEDEALRIAESCDDLEIVDKYAADGKSGDLNGYLVLRKR